MKRKKYYLCIKAVGEGAYISNYKPCNGDYCIRLSSKEASDIIFFIRARDEKKAEEPLAL